MLKNKKILPFWLLTFSVIIVLIVSQLVQEGIFMDGMLYISVSKNLAEGLGTFWNPHFSQTSMASFHEQPPLYFGLLALFYKIFGTSMYVERLFCFLCFIFTIFFIHKIWKKIYINTTVIANNSWLPILFFTTIPVCFWAYTNHVEETVMAVFATASVYYIYCALFLNEKTMYNLIIAGIFIFLSSLTKGIQGMFPIVAAMAYWLIIKNSSFKKALTYTLILVGIPFLIYLLLLISNKEVYDSFKKYFEIRLLGTFNNRGATTTNRFELLSRLFMELLPIAGLSGLILFFTKKHKAEDVTNNLQSKTILWFIIIGLAGALPLMVTLEQRGFYLVTTLPFFAIAIAMWVAPRISTLTNKIAIASFGYKLFNTLSLVLLLAAIIFSVSCIGKFKRDKDLLTDVYSIGKLVPPVDIIGIPTEMWNDWSFTEYMIRYFYISSDNSTKQHKYYIIRKNLPKELVPEDYQLLPITTNELDIYILKQ